MTYIMNLNQIENLITQKIDLINNNGLSSIMGYSAQQHHDTYKIFYEFLDSIRPLRILEIGTALGGFTQFLGMVNNWLSLNMKIQSYDIHTYPWYSEIKNNHINIITQNIFSDNYQNLKDSTIIDFIRSPGTTIVLCDGGCKRCEFNILSQYLKPQDIIMAHDYAPNETYFHKYMYQKIWNWHELEDSDIIESINKFNLERLWFDKMLSVAWCCYRKV
jgi:hypothetical protein